jgi:hypothetical protein
MNRRHRAQRGAPVSWRKAQERYACFDRRPRRQARSQELQPSGQTLLHRPCIGREPARLDRTGRHDGRLEPRRTRGRTRHDRPIQSRLHTAAHVGCRQGLWHAEVCRQVPTDVCDAARRSQDKSLIDRRTHHTPCVIVLLVGQRPADANFARVTKTRPGGVWPIPRLAAI